MDAVAGDPNKIADRIREFILSRTDWRGSAEQLTDSYPLIDNVVDSLELVKLVTMVESDFAVVIPDDLLVYDNLCTIERIAALVAGLPSEQAA